jgi:N-acetylneuraminic acid mutarotase
MAVWASSATSVATIGAGTGQQTGVATGSTMISATIGSLNATTALSVVTNTWVAGNSLPESRFRHSATVLTTGNVLVAGGFCRLNTVVPNDLYSPLPGTWSATGGFAKLGCGGQTDTLLANGQVLAAGGMDQNTYSTAAEIYDPVAGTWASAGNMSTARFNHTATLLPNGKVLVVGSSDVNSTPSASAELYDPSLGTWSVTGSLSTPRYFHTATLLPNGKVLVAGGTFTSLGAVTETAEVYDPATGTWSPTGSLTAARTNHTATLLPNGTVLVAGGATNNGSTEGHANLAVLNTAEIYDPTSGTWSPTGTMSAPRWLHTAAALPSGKILLVGGQTFTEPAGNLGPTVTVTLATTDIFDPVSGTWTAAASMTNSRFQHTETVLPNGAVMVTGGTSDHEVGTSVELYYP